ncbi:MAG: TOBE domain-containing protein, partial [Bradymonadaceae bacterium]
VILQDEGRIHQVGAVEDVFNRPCSPAAARCVGVENLLDGRIVETAGGTALIDVGGIRLRASSPAPMTSEDVVVAVRAEGVRLGQPRPADGLANALSGTVAAVHPEGPLTRITLADPVALEIFVSPRDRIAPGQTIDIVIPSDAVHLIAAPTP